MTPIQRSESNSDSVEFGDVLAEILRPPYVWWLLIAMVLQIYTPIYITPVAAAIVATTAGLARQAVRSRTPQPALERTR